MVVWKLKVKLKLWKEDEVKFEDIEDEIEFDFNTIDANDDKK